MCSVAVRCSILLVRFHFFLRHPTDFPGLLFMRDPSFRIPAAPAIPFILMAFPLRCVVTRVAFFPSCTFYTWQFLFRARPAPFDASGNLVALSPRSCPGSRFPKVFSLSWWRLSVFFPEVENRFETEISFCPLYFTVFEFFCAVIKLISGVEATLP